MTARDTYQESDGCQVTGGPAARAVAGPVNSLDTDAAKRRVAYLLLRESPYSIQLTRLARWVFGDHVESGDKDWQWVRRECERQGHSLEQHGQTWVSPRSDDVASVLDTASGVSEHRADSPRSGVESVATANAAARLGCRRTLDTAGEWGVLIGALGAKRLGEERSGERPERTRFNRLPKALTAVEGVSTAFAGARFLQYSRGVVVTPTTDPSCFESIRDGTDSLLGDVKLLRRKLGSPPGVTVTEPTARGGGHAHVALFGVTEADLPSKHELHRYWWETRERGKYVDVTPIATDAEGESWRWAEQAPDAAEGCPPAAYLRAGPESLPAVARLDAEDVLAVAAAYRERGDSVLDADTADDIDAAVSDDTGVDAAAVRRAAWYFGTGLKTATRPSPALRCAVETTGGDA